MTKRPKYTSIQAVLDAMLAEYRDFQLTIQRDALGERIIKLPHARGQIYITPYGTGAALFYTQEHYPTLTGLRRASAQAKWDEVRRALMATGCELVQWGVNVGEGCLRFDPTNKKQLAAVLGVI